VRLAKGVILAPEAPLEQLDPQVDKDYKANADNRVRLVKRVHKVNRVRKDLKALKVHVDSEEKQVALGQLEP